MYAHKFGKPLEGIAPISMERLTRYNWPGNVRELQNVIERIAILASGHTLEIHEALDAGCAGRRRGPRRLAGGRGAPAYRARAQRVQGHHRGQTGCGGDLGLKPSTLRYRMKLLGLSKVARAA